MLSCNGFYNCAKSNGIVRGCERISITEIDFVLSRPAFVVRAFRENSHLLQCQTDLTADILSFIIRRNVHIACLIIGSQCCLTVFIQPKKVKLDFGAKREIRDTIQAHKRIIFNGNGYDDAWIEEAVEQRGLLNLRTTPDALRPLLSEKNMEMLTRHKVYTETELCSRYEIQLENYVRTVRIEALTMVDMARKDILPAVVGYCDKLLLSMERKKTIGGALTCGYETRTAGRLSTLTDRIDEAVSVLESAVKTLDGLGDYAAEGDFIRDEVIPKMAELRAFCDEAETLTAAEYWPFPTYGDLLFGV